MKTTEELVKEGDEYQRNRREFTTVAGKIPASEQRAMHSIIRWIEGGCLPDTIDLPAAYSLAERLQKTRKDT